MHEAPSPEWSEVQLICEIPFEAGEQAQQGNKKFPIFVAFWHVGVGAPWGGMLRVCRIKDKTAKTQAELFYDTIVDVLGYPRGRVMFVLSDNTASVSAK